MPNNGVKEEDKKKWKGKGEGEEREREQAWCRGKTAVTPMFH